MTSRIICVGLGPGDPELMSVRADRLVRSARHVAFFRKPGRPGRARTLVDGMISADAIEYPMEYPVTTEIPVEDPEYNRVLAAFYDDWTARLESVGEDVIVLCEGDPLFYGSFMHLQTRLEARNVPVNVVPGITGMSGCWTAVGQPMTWGDDVLTVAMATLSEDDLAAQAKKTDALVVMKIGRNLPKLKRALDAAGRLEDAVLVECGTMEGERVLPLSDVDGPVPYFSIVLIHGHGRRP